LWLSVISSLAIGGGGKMSRYHVVFGALNVVAHPHPEGIYVSLLTRASEWEVRLWGADYGSVTAPKEWDKDPNIYLGRVLLWTRINRSGQWYDKKKKQKASEEDKKKIVLPDEFEPNFRNFNYALNVKKHLLIVEHQNEWGERFGPQRAERLFSLLFSADVLGDDIPDVSITAIPEAASVTNILALPKLRRLAIHLRRPNPDDLTDDYARILEEMEQEKLKAKDIILHKAPGAPSLTPNKVTQLYAQVAAENGYVEATWRDEDGKNLHESTRSHPKQIVVPADTEDTGLVKFFSSIRLF
jgi:hypothetical protein